MISKLGADLLRPIKQYWGNLTGSRVRNFENDMLRSKTNIVHGLSQQGRANDIARESRNESLATLRNMTQNRNQFTPAQIAQQAAQTRGTNRTLMNMGQESNRVNVEALQHSIQMGNELERLRKAQRNTRLATGAVLGGTAGIAGTAYTAGQRQPFQY